MESTPAVDRAHYPLFDPIRLVAATLVLVSHAFVITGHHEPQPVRLGVRDFSWGSLAVAVFFITSGFVVLASWERVGSASFLWRRFWRIFPGYLLAVAAGVVLVAPLVGDLGVRAFFTHPQTRSYWLHTSLMAPVKFTLPGVFTHLPNPSINGSLWTLPYEVLAYIGLAIAGAVGLLRRNAAVVLGYALFLAAFWVIVEHNRAGIPTMGFRFVQFVTWFVGGALAWRFRRFVVGRHATAAVAAVALAAGLVAHTSLLVLPAATFLVVYCGTFPTRTRPGFAVAGNLSYGVYLYAFPVSQCLAYAGLRRPWVLSALALPISLGVAAASWNLVERRGIRVGRGWPPVRRRGDESVLVAN